MGDGSTLSFFFFFFFFFLSKRKELRRSSIDVLLPFDLKETVHLMGISCI